MVRKRINFKHSDDLLRKSLKHIHPYDLSVLYPKLEHIEKERLLAILDIKKIKVMFTELESEEQHELINALSENKQKEMLRQLENDDLKEFMESLDQNDKDKIITLLPKIKAKTIELLLSYDDDLAASIMTTEYMTISKDLTIKEATHKIVTLSKDSDYIDTLFIIDDEKKILGIIDLKDLIMARSDDQLIDIMDDDYHYVFEDDSIEKAIQTVMDYDRNVIPVVDRNFHIIGMITADDIFDELIESSEDDYQKMALLRDHENTSSPLKRASQRLPWLLIAVFLNLIIASLLSLFEATLVEVIALALFQPLILGMAGNIGTQSLAVTILGIHLEDIDDQKISKNHASKETLVGFLNSFFLAIGALIFVFLFLTLIPTGQQAALEIALVVSIAVFSSMFVSALIGFLIPLSLRRLKIDPSVASGPIITTINDVVALVIYFGVATLFFIV